MTWCCVPVANTGKPLFFENLPRDILPFECKRGSMVHIV